MTLGRALAILRWQSCHTWLLVVVVSLEPSLPEAQQTQKLTPWPGVISLFSNLATNLSYACDATMWPNLHPVRVAEFSIKIYLSLNSSHRVYFWGRYFFYGPHTGSVYSFPSALFQCFCCIILDCLPRTPCVFLTQKNIFIIMLFLKEHIHICKIYIVNMIMHIFENYINFYFESKLY